MVTVRLTGGLGNQLFQYAVGRTLAWRRRVPLQLETSFYDGSDYRRFELAPFELDAEIVDWQLDGKRVDEPGRWDDLLFRLRHRRRVVREPGWDYHPEVLDRRDGVFLIGYWQTNKYFDDVADDVRASLRDAPLSAAAGRRAGEIATGPSVAVHVRRGDYLDPTHIDTIGYCDLNYYERALAAVAQQVGAAKYYVFSDDPAWCAANLSPPGNRVIVSGEGLAAYEELLLLSRCDHAIIANSSFSWWGAWLRDRAERVVVSPARWFRTIPHHRDDRTPAHWLRV